MTLEEFDKLKEKHDEFIDFKNATQNLVECQNGRLTFVTPDGRGVGSISLYAYPEIYEYLVEYFRKRVRTAISEFNVM